MLFPGHDESLRCMLAPCTTVKTCQCLPLMGATSGTWQGPVLQLEGLLSPGTAADPST